jgi:hypothetical protein
MSGMRPNTTYGVGCWETSDASGNGGIQVTSFQATTDSAGAWTRGAGATCTTADNAYTNLRIGPNLIWSNTIAPVPAVPSGATLTISRGSSVGGGRSNITLAARGLRANTGFTVGCWETSDSTGNGGSQVASFSITTDGSGNWDGSGCATADSAYTNLRIGPNLIWSNTIAPVPVAPPARTWSETAGPPSGSGTFTNYLNAGGTLGPGIGAYQTVQVSCKIQGFRVADGNTWWYRIASAPWSNQYYAPADNFYNNGATGGSLHGTPFVDSNVPNC